MTERDCVFISINHLLVSFILLQWLHSTARRDGHHYEISSGENVRRWPLYDIMAFLLPSCSTGATSGNLPNVTAEDDKVPNENSSVSSDDELPCNSTPVLPLITTPDISRNTPTMQPDQNTAAAPQPARPQVPLKKTSHKFKTEIPVIHCGQRSFEGADGVATVQ